MYLFFVERDKRADSVLSIKAALLLGLFVNFVELSLMIKRLSSFAQ